MSKNKRGKSGGSSTTELLRWETDLICAELQDDDWRPLVVFLAPECAADKQVLDVVAQAVETGARKLFSMIDFQGLLKEISEISAQSKVAKGKLSTVKSPQFVEICDQVKALLDQGEKLSSQMKAKILKFKLLMLKQKDLDQREEERKAKEAASKARATEGSKSPSKAGGGSPRAKSGSPGKGGKKGKKDDVPMSPKKETKMKKRGEEDDNAKTIDDEPNGPGDPHRYFLITGIYDVAALHFLSDIKVPIHALISLKAECKARPPSDVCMTQEDNSIDMRSEAVCSERMAVTAQEELSDRNVEDSATNALDLQKFWRESEMLVSLAPTGNKLRDIAKFNVFVKEDCLPEQSIQSLSPESKIQFGMLLFNKMADVCYDFLAFKEQYKKYMDALHLTDVSALHQVSSRASLEESPVSAVQPASSDLPYYRKLLSEIPSGCDSIALTLDCLLEQVVVMADGSDPLDATDKKRDDGLSHAIGSYFDKKLSALGLGVNKISDDGVPSRKSCPQVIYSGNSQGLRLSTLPQHRSSKFAKTESNMRTMLPYARLASFIKPSQEDWVESFVRRKQLYSFCNQHNSVSYEKFERAMRQYVFESLPLDFWRGNGSACDAYRQKEQIKRIASRYDEPYVGVQSLSRSSSCQSDQSPSRQQMNFRNLDQYCCLEYLEPDVLLQVLDEASWLRPYVDTYYNRGNNTLLAVFHNPVNDELQNSLSWTSWLHSDVGFRNFLRYVAVEIQDWIKLSEEAAEAKRLAEQKLKEDSLETPTKDDVPVKERSRFGMLTRAELLAKKLAEKEQEKKKGGRSRSGSPKKSPALSPDKKKSALRSSALRRTAVDPAKSTAKIHEPKPCVEPTQLVPNPKTYAFFGYNLGDDLLHAYGEESFLFPADGSLVRVVSTDLAEKTRQVTASVCRRGHTFRVHFLNPKDDATLQLEREASLSKQLGACTDEGKDPTLARGTSNGVASLALPPLPDIPPPLSAYSCLNGHLSDGLFFVMSATLAEPVTHCHADVSKIFSSVQKGPSDGAFPPSSSGTNAPKSPKGRRKGKDDEQRIQEELGRQAELERQRVVLEREKELFAVLKERESCQNLYAVTPNGVHVSFVHSLAKPSSETQDMRKTFVLKQSIVKEDVRERSLESSGMVSELFRVFTIDAALIKFMSDDSVEVMLADGSYWRSTVSGRASLPVVPQAEQFQEPPPRTASSVRHTAKGKSPKPAKHQPDLPLSPPPVAPYGDASSSVGCDWTVVDQAGCEWNIRNDAAPRFNKRLLCSVATCPTTGQVLKTREDGVLTVDMPDGGRMVEFTDGTRISTSWKLDNTKSKDQETGEDVEREASEAAQCITFEHDLYGTVECVKEPASLSVIFGNGRTVAGYKNGGYILSNLSSVDLVIDKTGVALLPGGNDSESSQCAKLTERIPDVDLLPANACVLNHCAQMCLYIKDHLGAEFFVRSVGEYGVEKPESLTCSSTLKPRYFVIQSDGSGEELLTYDDVCDYVRMSEEDKACAVIRQQSESDPDATGITIVKPYKGKPSDIWRQKPSSKNIVPIGLQERDFNTFPAKESKTPGPKFGTNAGVAFDAGKRRSLESSQRIAPCPEVLEVRHIVQYRQLTDEVREQIMNGISLYGDFVKQQQEIRNSLLPQESQSEEEREAIAILVRKYNELHGMTHPSKDHSKDDSLSTIVAEQYLHGVSPAPPSPKVVAHPERSASEWERDRIELAELKHAKEMMRTRNFPKYFDTSEGQQFLYSASHGQEVKRLAENLARETIHPSVRSPSIASTITENPSSDSCSTHDNPAPSVPALGAESSVSIDSSVFSMNFDASSCLVTSHASSHVDSALAFRPNNPTPVAATGCLPDDPVRAHHEYLDIVREVSASSTEETTGLADSDFRAQDSRANESMMYDVYGAPRKGPIKTPRSIAGCRPNALPNQQFSTVEDPVRRRVRTASVAGAINASLSSKLRGFILSPDLVDFGVLKEGLSYSHPVNLKNIGVEPARFKIKQPPPSTGLKVVFKPGSVAPGMSTVIHLELFAVAVGVEGNSGIGQVSHHVEIVSETNVMYLPVIATILTQQEYDRRTGRVPDSGPSRETFVLGERPSSREALTRPRKD